MASKTLTAGILGLGERGQLMLKAALASGHFQIEAVADPDPQRAEKAGHEYGGQFYTDYRQLIVQNQLDCLFVPADIHACDEHLKAAIKKKFNILKLAPPARDFEETLEYAQMAESEKTRFAIINPNRFRSSYATAHELLAQGHIESVFMISAYCSIPLANRPTWQTDPKLAGGGVLLHDCYPLIDQILWNFPLPQQVYALNTNQSPDKQQRLYLTEDTSVVSMKFSEALVGHIVATRRNDVGPAERSLKIYGKDALLTVTDQQVTVRTPEGRNDQTWQYDETEQDAMQRLLSSFAQSVQAPDEHEPVGSTAENLKNMAVVESAYLSARTGIPEEPARILQITGIPSQPATNS